MRGIYVCGECGRPYGDQLVYSDEYPDEECCPECGAQNLDFITQDELIECPDDDDDDDDDADDDDDDRWECW